MALPNIIYLAGKKRSGKGSIAKQLERECGYTSIHIASDWLDNKLREWNISREVYEANKGAYRAKVQMAAAISRAEDPYCLLHTLTDRIKAAGEKVVVDGVRFTNECLHGMALGALVVKVQVNDTVRRHRFLRSDEPLELFSDRFEDEIDRIPCHLIIPGDLGYDEIVPTLEASTQMLYAYKGSLTIVQ